MKMNYKMQNQLIKKNKVLFKKRFPAAKLLHHREDNYRILKHYLSLGEAGSWSPAIEARLRLRISSLKLSRPKSPLKRLIWKMRTRSAQIAFNRMIKKHNLKKVKEC